MNIKDVKATLYIKERGCPECDRLHKLVPTLPKAVTLVDATTADGLANAMMNDVYGVPTLLIQTAEGPAYLTSADRIAVALEKMITAEGESE